MSPTVINVIPNPCNGLGTSLYSIFSRIAPMDMMASVHPSPEPNAYTSASITLPIYCELDGSRLILCCIKSEAPMMAQFTAISGRKIPSAAYSEGDYLSTIISTSCTIPAMTAIKRMKLR